MLKDEIWQPDMGSTLASMRENDRVRKLYLEEKEQVLRDSRNKEHPPGCKCRACGTFRGDLARAWVEMAERSKAMTDVDLRIPGGEAPRKPLRKGETITERRVDAARTRIRQFEAGHNEFQWVLTGIETTIADRHGWSYPAGAYRSQRQLF